MVFHMINSVFCIPDITCDVELMHSHLHVLGGPATNEKIKIGHKLQFYCDNQYVLDGPQEIECLQTGQWNEPFPTCAGMFIFSYVTYIWLDRIWVRCINVLNLFLGSECLTIIKQ